MKRTKIVCTIGPSSSDKKTIEKLVNAGMNVARLNMSHGTYPEHQKVINNIRQVAKETKKTVAILADLQGPRIRIGTLPAKGITIKTTGDVVLSTASKVKPGVIPVTYAQMHKDVKPGERILIADGLMELKVIHVDGQNIHCRVVNGGIITSNKGINLPDTDVKIASLSEKDKRDIKFGLKNKVDFFALSFVRHPEEVKKLQQMIKNSAMVIAKIEKPEAVLNIRKIIEAADGIMVARGDLGIEMPQEDVPLIQKDIINLCLKKSKPVIVATQMLESMIVNPRPTRAEVSDVANAVIDHTDAVMLSGETASGKYPVDAVSTMAKVIVKVEKSQFDNLDIRKEYRRMLKIDDAFCLTATNLAKQINAKLVLVASLTGYTGRIVSRYRPELPILVSTNTEKVKNQLNLSWGVVPFILPPCKSIEELIDRALDYIKKNNFVSKCDKIIIIAGQPVGQAGNVNWVKVHEI